MGALCGKLRSRPVDRMHRLISLVRLMMVALERYHFPTPVELPGQASLLRLRLHAPETEAGRSPTICSATSRPVIAIGRICSLTGLLSDFATQSQSQGFLRSDGLRYVL